MAVYVFLELTILILKNLLRSGKGLSFMIKTFFDKYSIEMEGFYFSNWGDFYKHLEGKFKKE